MILRRLKSLLVMSFLAYSIYVFQAPSTEAIPLSAEDKAITLFISEDRLCSGEIYEGRLQSVRHCFSDLVLKDYAVEYDNGELSRLDMPNIKSYQILKVFSYTNRLYEMGEFDLQSLSELSIEIPTLNKIDENSFFKRMDADFIGKKGNETFAGFKVPELSGNKKILAISKEYDYFGFGDSGMPVYAIVDNGYGREMVKIGHISAQYGKSFGERIAHKGETLDFEILYGSINEESYYQIIKLK